MVKGKESYSWVLEEEQREQWIKIQCREGKTFDKALDLLFFWAVTR
jgi:hypothetical protein